MPAEDEQTWDALRAELARRLAGPPWPPGQGLGRWLAARRRALLRCLDEDLRPRLDATRAAGPQLAFLRDLLERCLPAQGLGMGPAPPAPPPTGPALRWASEGALRRELPDPRGHWDQPLAPGEGLRSPVLRLHSTQPAALGRPGRGCLHLAAERAVTVAGETLCCRFEWGAARRGEDPAARAEEQIRAAAPPPWPALLARPGTALRSAESVLQEALGAFFAAGPLELLLDPAPGPRLAAQLEQALVRAVLSPESTPGGAWEPAGVEGLRRLAAPLLERLESWERGLTDLARAAPWVLRRVRVQGEPAPAALGAPQTPQPTPPPPLELPGLLVQGEACDALRLLRAELAEAVQLVYIDPPYNTGGQGFAYRDRYDGGQWLCLLDEVLAGLRASLRPEGSLYAQIDYQQKERLRLLLDRHLRYGTEIIWRIGWISGFKSRAQKFVRNHDTIYQYSRGTTPLFLKHYLPYPPGYRRRDGKAPTGKGIPLEDTWNCSELDRLPSIQILSFSHEKVGAPDATQKPEALLARVLRASSREGDRVLDCFLGTGTSAAVAAKLRRRWVGVERDARICGLAAARLTRVVRGEDPHGLTAEAQWSGGGGFDWLTLQDFASRLADLRPAPAPEAQDGPEASPPLGLRFAPETGALLPGSSRIVDPWPCTPLGSGDESGAAPSVDLQTTCEHLLELRAPQRWTAPGEGLAASWGELPGAAGLGLVLLRRLADGDEALRRALAAAGCPLRALRPSQVWVNGGPADCVALPPDWPRAALEPALWDAVLGQAQG